MVINRKTLCKDCRAKVQKADANYMRTYRERQKALKQAQEVYSSLKERGLAKDSTCG